MSDFCVKNLKILVSVRCGRECQMSQCSLKNESCVECVETHECSLLTGSFFAELANQFDLSCNSFCAHSFVIRKLQKAIHGHKSPQIPECLTRLSDRHDTCVCVQI